MQIKSLGSYKPLLLIGAVVLGFRLFLVDMFREVDSGMFESLSPMNGILISLTIAFASYFFVRYLSIRMPYGHYSVTRFGVELLYLIFSSATLTFIVSWSEIMEYSLSVMLDSGDLGLSFLSILLINTFVLYIINIVLYFRNRQQRALAMQVAERNRAHYLYNQLKRQTDPHFLFNSLSVLDSLIEIDAERAGRFTRRLASLYRYMLASEGKLTVRLGEEMIFVEAYVELMNERFGGSIEFTAHGVEEFENRHVVPFSIQILVENAIKHNATSEESPLEISIEVTQDGIKVVNNVQKKGFKSEHSTGVGLNYILVQYEELTSKQIKVHSDGIIFEVNLPLI